MTHPVLTIARLTLYEARRRRIMTAALVCAGAFIAVYAAGMFFVNADMEQKQTPFVVRLGMLGVLTVAGIYAANFLTLLLAVLLPVDTLSGEIESGVMQTIASKPIDRADIVLGKWLGHGIVVCAYLALLLSGVLLVSRVTAGYVQINIGLALALMVFEVLLMMTVSIAGGTRLSTVTNGIMALGFYGVSFIGGFVEQIGGFAAIESAKMVGIVASLISPPDALWRLASHHLQPELVRSLDAPPLFAVASVPSPLMVWWAAGFLVATLVFAVRSFRRRAL
jgi:Cu-processing system permease protein